jgi:hydrogenase/urease accessory protein HupE
VKRPALTAAGAALLLGQAAPAVAHAPIPGIGVFLSGAVHPFIAPALLLSLTALGLLLGQHAQGRLERVRVPFIAYATALVLGLALNAWRGDVDTDRLLLLCGALAAGTVALAWAMPASIHTTLATVIGLATGLASAPSGVEGRAYAAMLAGTVIASLVLPGWVVAVVNEIERAWLKIAVRVLGSWLAAAALLVLSLTFAPAARA